MGSPSIKPENRIKPLDLLWVSGVTSAPGRVWLAGGPALDRTAIRPLKVAQARENRVYYKAFYLGVP